jgi:hypothetical protein
MIRMPSLSPTVLERARCAAAPVAVAAIPIVSLYMHNRFVLGDAAATVLAMLVVASLAALALFALCWVATRAATAACVICSLLIVLLYSYRGFHWVAEHVFANPTQASYTARSLYTLLFVYCVACLGIARWRHLELRVLANTLVTIALSVLAVLAVQATWQLASAQAAVAPARVGEGRVVSDAAGRPHGTPDIYYVILDGYGRGDVYERLLHADNTPFLRALEDRGFFVADQSRSNYLQTVPSMSSSLNFRYHEAQEASMSPRDYLSKLTLLVKQNEAARFLRANGYTIVSVGSGHYLADPNPFADVEFPFTNVMALDFEGTVLTWTPLVEFVSNGTLNQAESHRARVLHSLRYLKQSGTVQGPKFVFSHIVCPHPPYVFGADGGEPRYDLPTMITDHDVIERERGKLQEMYVDQTRFLNSQLLSVIDGVLGQYSTENRPIIILQADHGPALGYNGFVARGAWLYPRSGILNAMLVPREVETQLYESISPVNTFRVIFNGLFDAGLPLLEDHTEFHHWEEPAIHTRLDEAQIDEAELAWRAPGS